MVFFRKCSPPRPDYCQESVPWTCTCWLFLPLCLLRLGGKCDFYRHVHSVLESNNKQIVNFGIFPLFSRYHIYEMRVHSSYAHICGTTERGIILTDCQLLCLWKLVLFVHDLELLVLSWRATSLTRYSLSSDSLTSPAFAATFLTRKRVLRYFLFWDKSLNWWSLWYSAYGLLVISYVFSLFRSRVQGLLRICCFFLGKISGFFQNRITSSWLYYAPALKFIASRYLPWFSDSLCVLSAAPWLFLSTFTLRNTIFTANLHFYLFWATSCAFLAGNALLWSFCQF